MSQIGALQRQHVSRSFCSVLSWFFPPPVAGTGLGFKVTGVGSGALG